MEVTKQIVMKKISEIKPYVRNPRKNDKTVDILCELIPKVGFNQPILIDKNSVIVKGHARYTAAIRLGMEEVPCVVTEADEEAIRLDRITDNKISELTEWNQEELLHELDSLNLDFDFDFTEIGLPNLDFDMPAFDDFDDEKEDEISEEEKRAKYEAFLAQNKTKEVQIVSEKEIEKAIEKQEDVGKKKDKYYKVTCSCCGNIMFIKEGDAKFEY